MNTCTLYAGVGVLDFLLYLCTFLIHTIEDTHKHSPLTCKFAITPEVPHAATKPRAACTRPALGCE